MARKGKYAVVVGCGRMGSYIAHALSRGSWDVVVVDIDPQRFAELAPDFSGFTIEGDAVEMPTLEQAKTGAAALFVAASGRDSVNLMTSQIARRHFGVESVACTIHDPDLEALCRMVNVTPITPVTTTAENLLRAMGIDDRSPNDTPFRKRSRSNASVSENSR